MKGFLSVFLFSMAFWLSACAQTRSGIQKAVAVYKILVPGNIPVDDNGNPLQRTPDTLRFVYLETKENTMPQIESVQYGNGLYRAAVFAEKNVPLNVGQPKASEEGSKPYEEYFFIIPKNGNSLWRLELSFLKNISASKTKRIIVIGKLNGKPFNFAVKKEVQLASEIRR